MYFAIKIKTKFYDFHDTLPQLACHLRTNLVKKKKKNSVLKSKILISFDFRDTPKLLK
jgi:hypothetical protein